MANLFDMTVSNFHASFNKVLIFLVDDLAPEIIKFPDSNTEKEDIAKEFEKVTNRISFLEIFHFFNLLYRYPVFQMFWVA